MKRILLAFLSLSWLAASCSFESAQLPTATAIPDPFQTPWDDRSIFESGLVASAQPVLAGLAGASVYHLEFEIAESLQAVSGREQVRYTNTEAVALGEIQLRLFGNLLGGDMRVSDVRVADQPVQPGYGLQNSLLVVPLPASLEPGQSTVISLDFTLEVPQQVERNYGVQAYLDSVLALAHAYPMICVYDEEGWNAEIPSEQGDLTYSDASFYLVRVRAPRGLSLVTTGRELASAEAGRTQTVIVASGPARDFFLAASRDFAVLSETFGEVTIRSLARPEAEAGARFAIQAAARAVEVFGRHYAPYPYTELDLVATPNLALGIEYPGAIALTAQVYAAGEASAGSQEAAVLEATVAHEVGHQFFYNLVGNDQLDDPWLDEALAQYATLQYYQDVYGSAAAEGFRASLTQRWKRVQLAEIPIGLPVVDYQGSEYGAIVYGRGPLFIAALQRAMGLDAFDAFLQAYARSFSWKIATPRQFQALAEQTCACQLDALFAQWVYP